MPLTTTPATPAIPAGRDYTDPDLYADRIPFEEFAELRARRAPMAARRSSARAPGAEVFGDDGDRVASRHADVKGPRLHPSGALRVLAEHGDRPDVQVSTRDLEMQKVSYHARRRRPDHTKLRDIVQRGFTPRSINALEAVLRQRTPGASSPRPSSAVGATSCPDLAGELPLQAIADLIGVPQEDRGRLFDWSNRMTGYDDPDLKVSDEDSRAASVELLVYAMRLAERRRESPADDIVTKLVEADRGDGFGRLGDDEFGFFVLMLVVAGNETTRNAITHGAQAFFDNPAQWELYRGERPKTAADEIVRWAIRPASSRSSAPRWPTRCWRACPSRPASASSCSTAARTTTRRPSATPTSSTSPATRTRTWASAAAAHSTASLAKMEINLMFGALADRSRPGPPRGRGRGRRLRSAWINGIKSCLPVLYR